MSFQRALSNWLLGGLLIANCGCRAIRHISENRAPLESRKLSRLGIEAMHHGQWDKAESLFHDALAVSDSDDRAHRGIAETLWNRGEHDLAVEHMEKAVRLSANDPRLVGRLGEMYLLVNRLDDAQAQSDLALESDRSSPAIWTLRGDCLRKRGDDHSALAAYHRALALQPDFSDAKLRVAELYLGQERYDRLLATLDRFEANIEGSQSPTRVHMLRGIAMKNLDRPGLAWKHFQKAATSDPLSAAPHLQMASIDLQLGRLERARESIAIAIRLDPELVQQSGWANVLDNHQRTLALAEAGEGARSQH